MTLLLVGNFAKRLEMLISILGRLFPDEDICTEADPLMAVKFALARPVDILFAEYNMKRMSGRQLGKIIEQTNPGVSVFLIGRQKESDASADDWTGFYGLTNMPVTEDALRDAMASLHPRGGKPA